MRHVRKHLRLTPAGLAAYLSERPNVSEVSPRQVRAWEQGREVPPYPVHFWIGSLEHRAWSQRLQRIRFAAAPLRTQIRMARRLGVPLGTYHAWDAGCHAPSPEYRARIEPTLAYLERLIAERDGQAGEPPDDAA